MGQLDSRMQLPISVQHKYMLSLALFREKTFRNLLRSNPMVQLDSMYDLLLVLYSAIWPNSVPLRDTRLHKHVDASMCDY